MTIASSKLRTLEVLGDPAGQRVFVRLDLNVPLEGGNVADDSRIRASLPTLHGLREGGASLVVASHLGRPKGAVVPELSLAPVARRLEELLGEAVVSVAEVTPTSLPDDPVVLLENLRFDPGEEANDVGFAGRLAELSDSYVDDAFGAAHRAHASVSALPELMLASGRAAVAGRLLQREVDVLSRLVEDPERPFIAILGGAKVSDKLAVIDRLLERVDTLLVGGAMAFTFIASQGGEVGTSLVEPELFDEVTAAKRKAVDLGVEIVIPTDVVVAERIDEEAATSVVAADRIPDGHMGLDIGPETALRFADVIATAKTILWNGPMGVFELAPFAAGTDAVARAVAECTAYSVAGGGDSLAAIARAGLAGAFDHLSTGGGASLEFLEGRALPGITILEESPT